jgi:hypothetical protein
MLESPELKVFHHNARVAIATWHDIVISIWRADVEVSDVTPAEAAQAALTAQYPRYGTLAVAEKGALRMSSEARHEAARITKLAKDKCCAIALVIPVEGFAGAAIRAAVTGVHLLTRSQIPQRSFDNIPASATWIFDKLKRNPSGVAAFVDACVHLRRPPA